MRWYHFPVWFAGGAFFVNALPHFFNGVSGDAFQSPFATPPGVGLSPAVFNVLWGAINFSIAWLLLARVGSFELRNVKPALAAGLGGFLAAAPLAWCFGQFHGGR